MHNPSNSRPWIYLNYSFGILHTAVYTFEIMAASTVVKF